VQPCSGRVTQTLRALVLIIIVACATATPQTPPGSGRPAPATVDQAGVSPADVHFMIGMIHHHAQAVLMAGWAPSHDASPALRALCERIAVGQRDEIALMQRWLRDRHQTVPDADVSSGHAMPGTSHSMLMPGMLTPEQLAQLDSARGPEFDRLFLLFMIQHHRGALAMVRELVDTPGAARDGPLFQIASDVSADQTTEIDRMTRMLAALSQPSQRSPQ